MPSSRIGLGKSDPSTRHTVNHATLQARFDDSGHVLGDRLSRSSTIETEMVPGSEAVTDVELMQQLKAGDDLALNDLVARWQEPLVSFVLRYTGNEQDALDLAQETFVRVYECRERYVPSGKFSTWLFTVASNLCRNQARWRERHPTISLNARTDEAESAIEQAVPSPGDTPADSAERNDLASAVREHIQKLPHDLRSAILLFEYQDLGYEEIAAILNCSTKAVETRLYRARKLLRDSLARWRAS